MVNPTSGKIPNPPQDFSTQKTVKNQTLKNQKTSKSKNSPKKIISNFFEKIKEGVTSVLHKGSTIKAKLLIGSQSLNKTQTKINTLFSNKHKSSPMQTTNVTSTSNTQGKQVLKKLSSQDQKNLIIPLTSLIISHHASIEGIFRLSPSQIKLNEIIGDLNHVQSVNINSEIEKKTDALKTDGPLTGELIKKILASNHIIPKSKINDFLSISTTSSEVEKMKILTEIKNSLDADQIETLSHLVACCYAVESQVSSSKMTSSNLAIVFATNIVDLDDFTKIGQAIESTKFLINNWDQLIIGLKSS